MCALIFPTTLIFLVLINPFDALMR